MQNSEKPATSRAEEVRRIQVFQAQQDATFVDSLKKIGIAVAVLALLCSVGYLVFRDTWERDNKRKLDQLLNEGRDAETAKDLKTAYEKYELITSLVGKRKLKDSTVQVIFDTAQECKLKIYPQVSAIIEH